MNNPLCPFCETELERATHPNPHPWYICPNPKCACEDGGMSLHSRPRPLKWVEWKRQQIALKRGVE